MKILITLCTFLLSLSVFAANPDKKTIERYFHSALSGVSKVEVLKISRRSKYIWGCGIIPTLCLDGVKEYSLEVRLTTDAYGDLDFECHLNHFHWKEYMNVEHCYGLGHKYSLRNFNSDPNGVISMLEK